MTRKQPSHHAMAKYLAEHGWRKLPRKPGRRLAWESPRTGRSWPTWAAFQIAQAQEMS